MISGQVLARMSSGGAFPLILTGGALPEAAGQWRLLSGRLCSVPIIIMPPITELNEPSQPSLAKSEHVTDTEP